MEECGSLNKHETYIANVQRAVDGRLMTRINGQPLWTKCIFAKAASIARGTTHNVSISTASNLPCPGAATCHDNAIIESFWGTLKTEFVHPCRFQTRQQAIDQITEYIELFYNRQRIQARLGYLSPAAFEQRFCQRQLGKI